jgi:hypothetical protein
VAVSQLLLKGDGKLPPTFPQAIQGEPCPAIHNIAAPRAAFGTFFSQLPV